MKIIFLFSLFFTLYSTMVHSLIRLCHGSNILQSQRIQLRQRLFPRHLRIPPYTFRAHRRKFSRRRNQSPVSIKTNDQLIFAKTGHNEEVVILPSIDDASVVNCDLGEINIKCTVRNFPIDKEDVKLQVKILKEILNVDDFDVDVWFCSEKKIREMNREYRDIDKSTDVLSFPINEFSAPEEIIDDGMLEYEKHLGDIVISPAYVQRVCDDDRSNNIYNDTSSTISRPEEVYDRYEDAGVSKAMTSFFTFQERVPLLLIHSMLHLLGYDHESEDDWKVMTAREEEVLKEFNQRYSTVIKTS